MCASCYTSTFFSSRARATTPHGSAWSHVVVTYCNRSLKSEISFSTSRLLRLAGGKVAVARQADTGCYGGREGHFRLRNGDSKIGTAHREIDISDSTDRLTPWIATCDRKLLSAVSISWWAVPILLSALRSRKCPSRLVSFPADFSPSVGKSTSGKPPIAFRFTVFQSLLASRIHAYVT